MHNRMADSIQACVMNGKVTRYSNWHFQSMQYLYAFMYALVYYALVRVIFVMYISYRLVMQKYNYFNQKHLTL